MMMTSVLASGLHPQSFGKAWGQQGNGAPEQIHLALGTATGSMVVTFATLGSNDVQKKSEVQLRHGSSDATTVSAAVSTYTEGGWVGLIHRATLVGLEHGVEYTYRCGVDEQWSAWTPIDYWKSKHPNNVTLAIVADLDGRELAGNTTIKAMTNAVENGSVNAILHAGDIAYIKGAENEATYDEYFREMQGAAAKVPYHVAVGNQEHWNEFAGYNARFSMPGKPGNTSNMWHSTKIGPVHAVFLSSEHDYKPDSPQSAFLEEDLAGVDRGVTPWVLVLLHRPLYCSTNDYWDCTAAGPRYLRPALEPILLKHKVTAVVAGHVHNYERTAPMNNGSATPQGPVHVTVGNAGDIEGMTHGWKHPRPDWSLVQSLELGWSRWTATMDSLTLEHLASGNGTVLDTYEFTKY